MANEQCCEIKWSLGIYIPFEGRPCLRLKHTICPTYSLDRNEVMCLGTFHMPLHVHGKGARKVNAAYNVMLSKHTGFLGIIMSFSVSSQHPRSVQVILGFSISHHSINPWPASIHLWHACILISLTGIICATLASAYDTYITIVIKLLSARHSQ